MPLEQTMLSFVQY